MSFKFKQAELGRFNTAEASKAIATFGPGCRIIGLTRGNFSLIDLIRAVLDRTGRAQIVCCTWSAGVKDAHQVKWLVDTRLVESFQLITDRSYETRQPKYAISVEDLFGKENIRVTDIHAKFVLIWNADYRVTIRTSMNLNANRTCENFELDEDKEIFKFYHSFVSDLIDAAPPGWEGRRSIVESVLDRIFNSENAVTDPERPVVRPGSLRLAALFREE